MNSLIMVLLFWFFPQPEQNKFVDSATLILSPGIELHLKASIFDSTKHTIKYCEVGPHSDPWKGVCLIDGRPVFGAGWEIPYTVLDEAYVMIGQKKIVLDISSMYNPWVEFPNKEFFSINQTEGGIIINAKFSDGDGSYEAQWFIIEGTSVRLKLDYSEER